MSLKFTLQAVCPHTGARAGLMETQHGLIETPVFMPVATKGSIRGVDWYTMESLGSQIVLANTYHLHIRPGSHIVERAGGLHGWSSWTKPFLTDSGGFQVFSFARRQQARILDDGVIFKDDIEGKLHKIGPSESMQVQRELGADIVMAFDECPPADAPYEVVSRAVDRTFDWAQQCMHASLKAHQSLFLIVQGGVHPDLRERSARQLTELDAPGYAIGGVSVGESREHVDRVVRLTAQMLPQHKPRYVMGVGTPRDIVASVLNGADMFDCVLPTRLARHGSFFVEGGRTQSVEQAEFTEDTDNPIVIGCQCPTCARCSRAYLKHLFKRKELTAYYYLAVHNIYTLHRITHQMRQAILAGDARQYASR